jgi:hypothetical protein
MKTDYYLWFLFLFILVCSCILCYRWGEQHGPIKYFKCENGVCTEITSPK